MSKHKVFICYHHEGDQLFKERLVRMSESKDVFIDKSVDTGEIDDSLPPQRIRAEIRDKFLRDSTVTIVLAGQNTKRRKHVDWEIYSSMINGKINKKSGILVINLPGTSIVGLVNSEKERMKVYRNSIPQPITSFRSRAQCEHEYPHLPKRIVDNLLQSEARISVVPWSRIARSPARLRWLIHDAFENRSRCRYDLSMQMRVRNS